MHGLDRAEVEVLALPAEGAGRGPSPDELVVAFLEPFPVFHGIDVGGKVSTPVHRTIPELTRPPEMTSIMAISSASPTGFSWMGRRWPSNRILAFWVVRASTAAVRLHEGVHARECAVVLIDHDSFVPKLVDVCAFVEVTLEQAVGRAGVKEAVGESEPCRRVLVPLLVRVFVIRKFAEVVDFHLIVLFLYFRQFHQLQQVRARERFN